MLRMRRTGFVVRGSQGNVESSHGAGSVGAAGVRSFPSSRFGRPRVGRRRRGCVVFAKIVSPTFACVVRLSQGMLQFPLRAFAHGLAEFEQVCHAVR